MSDSALLYGGAPNLTLLGLIGSESGRVLDIGCGRGALGERLRANGASWLVGVDISEGAASEARVRYDQVIVQPVEELTLDDLGGERFDLVVVADVLEHLVDPWAVLAKLRTWVVDGGRIAVSVPNLRCYSILLGLLLRGEFDYVPSGGMMDRGHLRWFTRRSLDAALVDAGWKPVARTGGLGPKRRALAAVSLGLLSDMLPYQLHAVARPATQRPTPVL